MKGFFEIFRKDTALSEDPRWQRFNDKDFACPCCGQNFSGIFDIGFDHPDPWPHGSREQSGLEILIVREDRLGTDLCTFDNNFLVRAILPLPIKGSDQRFAFGCWGSLSKENFDAYTNDALEKHNFEGVFSWLTNSLPTFETTDPLPCSLVPGEKGQRPSLWVHEGHALHDAQQDGISFDHLLDIYALAGSDIRPHLSGG